ncbi:D-TA family PLP-dependent enzyme [Mucilaginibacter koreensis]
MAEPWYHISNMDRLDTPALVVYPDRVKANIEKLINSVDDASRLRVHVKSHKSADATQLMIAAGITKFKCATIAEAEMLGRCKAPDALMAYPLNGPKLHRFIEVIKQYPQTVYSCLVDNEASARVAAQVAEQASINLHIYIDLNVGMNRTGILPDDSALQLYQLCSGLPGLHVLGLHAYDGHIHDVDFDKRKQHCINAFKLVYKLRDEIVASGLKEPTVIVGGSPTLPIHAQTPGVECSAGTFVYWDWNYTQQLADEDFLPAALVISRVVSVPAPNKLTLDVGHKSIASESELSKRIHFINAPNLKLTGHSEEHLMAETPEVHNYKVGDVLYGIPYHVCPTVALYERAYTVENGELAGEWPTTARDRKINL